MNTLRCVLASHWSTPCHTDNTCKKTAAKVKSRNNLLTKLDGSSWGVDAKTLHTSSLAVCCTLWPCMVDLLTRTLLMHSCTLWWGLSLALYYAAMPACLQFSLTYLHPTIARLPDKLLQSVETHLDWLVFHNFFNHVYHPGSLFGHQTCLHWRCVQVEIWLAESSTTNKFLVSSLTIRPTGLHLFNIQ